MKYLLVAATAALSMISAGSAEATVIFDINETATGISFSASGTFDKSLSTSNGTSIVSKQASVRPSTSRLILSGGRATNYAFNSSLSLGAGTSLNVITDSTGTLIGFIPSTFLIDENYVSNSAISAVGVINGKTLASAGLVAGTYNYTIGGNAMTINIKSYVAPSTNPTPLLDPLVAAVPEPATWAMMLVGFGMVAGAARHRRRAAKITFA